jgi:hypothetical protein
MNIDVFANVTLRCETTMEQQIDRDKENEVT